MKNPSQSLGSKIKDLRLDLGLSQSQVAQRTGKTQSQIARMERGLGDPGISSVVQVSRSLGTEFVLVPIRLLPAVRHLISEHGTGRLPDRPAKLVGNDPEDLEENGDDD